MTPASTIVILNGLGSQFRIPSKEFCDKVKELEKGEDNE